MRTTAVTCDRCRASILADGSVLSAEAGNLRKRRGPIALDLCQGCTDRLVEWLDGAAVPALAAPPETPA